MLIIALSVLRPDPPPPPPSLSLGDALTELAAVLSDGSGAATADASKPEEEEAREWEATATEGERCAERVDAWRECDGDAWCEVESSRGDDSVAASSSSSGEWSRALLTCMPTLDDADTEAERSSDDRRAEIDIVASGTTGVGRAREFPVRRENGVSDG